MLSQAENLCDSIREKSFKTTDVLQSITVNYIRITITYKVYCTFGIGYKNDILPKLAKNRTDTLIEFSQGAQFQLEAIPSRQWGMLKALQSLTPLKRK